MTEAQSPHSLRNALLIRVLLPVALIWVATSVIAYFDAQHEADELLDAHLAQSASLLVVQAGNELGEIDLEHSPQLHPYARRVAFQFWEAGTALRMHSDNAPNARLSLQDEGFSNAMNDGTRWRVFSTWDANRRFLIQVAERQDSRAEIAASIAKNLLLPLVVALPVLGLLVWLGVDRATRSLRSLSAEVALRAPDNLAAFEVREAPAEVEPLVANLNRLLARLQTSIDNERRFTADAAHELRTPLAALRAQAQVARGSEDEGQRNRALDNVIAGCDRASHLVDQLLTLARLEPAEFRAAREPLDLRAIARNVAAELAATALDKDIEVELIASSQPVVVPGDHRLLKILFQNLMDNAVRYSGPHTTVTVEVREDERGATAVIFDQGPGVPPDKRRELGKRFHRLSEHAATGTGLGLSIAKRIVELHDGALSFTDAPDGRGLRVEMRFSTANNVRTSA